MRLVGYVVGVMNYVEKTHKKRLFAQVPRKSFDMNTSLVDVNNRVGVKTVCWPQIKFYCGR